MLTDLFLSVAQAYLTAAGLKPKTLSHRVFGDAKVLPELLDGRRTLTFARGEAALQWFSDNWPENAMWPEGVARPQPSPVPEAPQAEVA